MTTSTWTRDIQAEDATVAGTVAVALATADGLKVRTIKSIRQLRPGRYRVELAVEAVE
jgi:hypothetical protein